MVFKIIGTKDLAQVPVESIEEKDQGTVVRWIKGLDSYEFQVRKGQQKANLYVAHDGVRYLVMMNACQNYLLDEESSTASRFIDNIQAVLLEGSDLLFSVWIALIIAYGFVVGLVYLIF